MQLSATEFVPGCATHVWHLQRCTARSQRPFAKVSSQINKIKNTTCPELSTLWPITYRTTCSGSKNALSAVSRFRLTQPQPHEPTHLSPLPYTLTDLFVPCGHDQNIVNGIFGPNHPHVNAIVLRHSL
ncbi:hypothetical protein BC826DRAFT_1019762 [Russula brevipes]|nr:hypothetical protein BC826DRAFT_1019762 [Russula brevipes]